MCVCWLFKPKYDLFVFVWFFGENGTKRRDDLALLSELGCIQLIFMVHIFQYLST